MNPDFTFLGNIASTSFKGGFWPCSESQEKNKAFSVVPKTALVLPSEHDTKNRHLLISGIASWINTLYSGLDTTPNGSTEIHPYSRDAILVLNF